VFSLKKFRDGSDWNLASLEQMGRATEEAGRSTTVWRGREESHASVRSRHNTFPIPAGTVLEVGIEWSQMSRITSWASSLLYYKYQTTDIDVISKHPHFFGAMACNESWGQAERSQEMCSFSWNQFITLNSKEWLIHSKLLEFFLKQVLWNK